MFIFFSDPLKLNGDINGSRFPLPTQILESSFPYDDSCREEEEDEEEEDDDDEDDEEEEEEENSLDAHTNGEVTGEFVPSQENGVDNMDIDSEIMNEDELMEVDPREVTGNVKSHILVSDRYNAVKKLSVSDVSADDSVSALERDDNTESMNPL